MLVILYKKKRIQKLFEVSALSVTIEEEGILCGVTTKGATSFHSPEDLKSIKVQNHLRRGDVRRYEIGGRKLDVPLRPATVDVAR
jgi:hypothetical protein